MHVLQSCLVSALFMLHWIRKDSVLYDTLLLHWQYWESHCSMIMPGHWFCFFCSICIVSSWLLLVWLPKWKKTMITWSENSATPLLLLLCCFWQHNCFFLLTFHVRIIWPYEAFKHHSSILELLIHAMDVEGEVLIQMSERNKANYLIVKWWHGSGNGPDN